MLQIIGDQIKKDRSKKGMSPPVGADNIIFNSGLTDQEIAGGAISYQTSDIIFDEKANDRRQDRV